MVIVDDLFVNLDELLELPLQGIVDELLLLYQIHEVLCVRGGVCRDPKRLILVRYFDISSRFQTLLKGFCVPKNLLLIANVIHLRAEGFSEFIALRLVLVKFPSTAVQLLCQFQLIRGDLGDDLLDKAVVYYEVEIIQLV